MNINEKLDGVNAFVTYVKGCKSAIRDALAAKGEEVPIEDTLDMYAAHVTSITGGGSGTTFWVDYLDWNETILKRQEVLQGGDVLAPDDPSREVYTFSGWAGSSLNVQSDLTIHAQYTYAPNVVSFTDYKGTIINSQYVETGAAAIPPTVDWGNIILDSWDDYTNIQASRIVTPNVTPVDDAAYLNITLTPETGLSPTFYFYIVGFGWIYVDYGDGVIENNPTFSICTMPHTYPGYGNYVVKITPSEGTTAENMTYLGWNSGGGYDRTVLMGNYSKAITKVITGTYVINAGYSFDGCSNLSDVCISKASTFIGNNIFRGCTPLVSILLPANVALIGADTFTSCSNLETIIIKHTSVVTLNGIHAFSGTSANLKIYVPANLVDTYKADAVWSGIASKIFSIDNLAV